MNQWFCGNHFVNHLVGLFGLPLGAYSSKTHDVKRATSFGVDHSPTVSDGVRLPSALCMPPPLAWTSTRLDCNVEVPSASAAEPVQP